MAMAWSDYRKASDMIPHSWIIECLEMFGIAENVKKKFLIDSMQIWKVELSSSGESLEVTHVRRGIFQGYFFVCLLPLTLVLRKSTAGYGLAKGLRLTIFFLWTT